MGILCKRKNTFLKSSATFQYPLLLCPLSPVSIGLDRGGWSRRLQVQTSQLLSKNVKLFVKMF